MYNLKRGQVDLVHCPDFCRPDQMAELLSATSVAGKVTARAAKETGLTEGIPVLTGTGENTVKYAEDLRKAGCEFVDLVNKTTILELGSVLQNCKALISVDTGTMHYAYALEVPTTAVFYETTTPKNWAPNPKLYNVALVKSEQTAENIYQKTIDLINGVKH